MPARDLPGATDRCDECAHPEQLHDERIRSYGNGRCPTCSVCVAEEAAASARGATSDGRALDALAIILRAPTWWSPVYLDIIRRIAAAAGRSTEHSTPCDGCGLGGWHDGTCSSADAGDIDVHILYRVAYEDKHGEELVPHDTFTTLDAALEHFRATVAHPWSPELAGIYVTGDSDHGHGVMVAHTFDPSEQR